MADLVPDRRKRPMSFLVRHEKMLFKYFLKASTLTSVLLQMFSAN